MVLTTRAKINVAFDVMWSGFALLSNILILAWLGYQYTTGNVTNLNWFVTYIVLGLISTLLAGLSVLYHVFDRKHDIAAEKGLASALYLSDTTRIRFLSSPLAKISTVFIVTFLTLLITFTFGQIVNPSNPYSNEPLTQSAIEQHSFLTNLANIGVVPGFFEEAPIFFIVNIIVFIITWGTALILRDPKLRHNVGLFIVAVFIAVTIGAGIFTGAHNTAYGYDTEAKVSAFVFEWVVQAMNQVTGGFFSWIPHMVHNSIVVVNKELPLSVGGTPAGAIA